MKPELPGEACFGCGIADTDHPMRAVLNEVDAGTGRNPLKFVTVHVCGLCHTEPTHRRRPIKGHFFIPQKAEDARQLAGVRDKQGNPVRTP